MNHCVLAHYVTVLPSTSVLTYSDTPALHVVVTYSVRSIYCLLALPYRSPVAVQLRRLLGILRILW